MLKVSFCHISLPVPLSAPRSLRVSELSHNSIRLSWKAAQGATQYLVLCSAAPDGAEDYTTEVRSIRMVAILLFLCLGSPQLKSPK